MTIWDDGIALDAVFTKPEGKDRGPVCVLIHGFTGWKDEDHILAAEQAMLEAGVAVLRADMYGHGKSGGQFHDHTLFKWMSNAMTLIDYVRGLDYTTDIYLCGHSQGGLAVILAAGLEHDRVKALIPMSPAWKIPENCRKGIMLGLPFDPDRVPEDTPAWSRGILGGNYIRVAQTIHVEDFIKRYKGPVLIIHGEGDLSVPVEDSIELAKMYPDCTYVPIPEDTHCYDLHLDMAAKALKEWLTALQK
ncbi:MAG: alpha/beta fold hydrolase [Lachnospiraceae bacterium]|nr:alpha/beta fold hydrolase [Lachnospiraceae bacterium]